MRAQQNCPIRSTSRNNQGNTFMSPRFPREASLAFRLCQQCRRSPLPRRQMGTCYISPFCTLWYIRLSLTISLNSGGGGGIQKIVDTQKEKAQIPEQGCVSSCTMHASITATLVKALVSFTCHSPLKLGLHRGINRVQNCI